MVTAVRGATTVEFDTESDTIDRVLELVDNLFESNKLEEFIIISIIFSVTDDLVAINPAAALRAKGGYSDYPLFCTQEPKSIGALKQAIRVLITWNGDGTKGIPCYLHNAKVLRPDLV